MRIALTYSEKAERARRTVTKAVHDGELRPASAFDCAHCGRGARDYHHHKGYEPEHWLDVIPLCKPCHQEVHRPAWSAMAKDDPGLSKSVVAQRWMLLEMRKNDGERWIKWVDRHEMGLINKLYKRGVVELVEFKTNPGRSLYRLNDLGRRIALRMEVESGANVEDRHGEDWGKWAEYAESFGG